THAATTALSSPSLHDALPILGFVDSHRGRTGGIFLTERGRTATVGQIVRGLEGASEVVDCAGEHPCPLAAACKLRRMLARAQERSEEHTSELQSRENLVCRLL